MRKLILTISFIAFYIISFAQLEIPKLKDTTDKARFPTDTSLIKVLNKSKVAIIFSRFSAWTIWQNSKIISYQNDNKWHYYVLVHPDTAYLFFEIQAPQDSIKKVWNSIKANNLFSIPKENLYEPNCDAMVYDSHHYEFWIVVKDQYRKIHYYNPEFFEERCESNAERKRIIECAKTFQEFIKRYK